MEGKTDNSQKKEEHDSLKPARDAIATAMRAAQFAKATGTPLPKPLKWQREFYNATGVFPYGRMNAEDLRSIMDEGYEKFCEYVERYEREKRRTQYGT